MTDRDTTNNGDKDKQERPVQEQEGGVPGAHGNTDPDHDGATGSSILRRDHTEIQPSEDVGDDED